MSDDRQDRADAGRFAEGNAIGADTRFRPGQSGNPLGRPKMPRELRERWRAAANALVDRMTSETDPDALQAQAAAFRELADRSGMEPESVQMRAFAAALAAPTLSNDQRTLMLKTWEDEQRGPAE